MLDHSIIMAATLAYGGLGCGDDSDDVSLHPSCQRVIELVERLGKDIKLSPPAH